jgi:hypothetical protein
MTVSGDGKGPKEPLPGDSKADPAENFEVHFNSR